ncbi:MAG: hypothetical protein HYV28_07315 [Ignavibacteriales bacterium]|nr:hypothetical protein [Ignavibacteriales bacterium]
MFVFTLKTALTLTLSQKEREPEEPPMTRVLSLLALWERRFRSEGFAVKRKF